MGKLLFQACDFMHPVQHLIYKFHSTQHNSMHVFTWVNPLELVGRAPEWACVALQPSLSELKVGSAVQERRMLFLISFPFLSCSLKAEVPNLASDVVTEPESKCQWHMTWWYHRRFLLGSVKMVWKTSGQGCVYPSETTHTLQSRASAPWSVALQSYQAAWPTHVPQRPWEIVELHTLGTTALEAFRTCFLITWQMCHQLMVHMLNNAIVGQPQGWAFTITSSMVEHLGRDHS